ncbi:alpha-L-fucosidase [Croceivirga radicis]|uniref:alpha-L-fucosidase n=1 Tax=Croceivirga radicis TaxID=1929488 RepID=A0A1V6LNK5_9FLAO|nr:alpha-L-fucosidase [Croceivirga radicis]OQD41742.1 alpha-L-fucosidase [Croceivirga radicis]
MKNNSLLLLATFFTLALTQGQTRSKYLPETLPSIPKITKPKTENSVPMGAIDQFEELKLNTVPVGNGPFKPTWSSIEENYPGEPKWLRDAKFGIWVHFGPQASGASGDWYARRLYVDGTLAHKNHLKNHGHPSKIGYKEVLRDWNPKKLDPKKLTEIYKDAGARFLILQGVHHDNFDLWDSYYHPWNSVEMGPKRDLIAEWANACKELDMRYGITFQHEYTWWWWQTAFGGDRTGAFKGIPYDGNLKPEDGKGLWWDGLDPRQLYGISLREYKGVTEAAYSAWSPPKPGIYTNHIPYAKWFTTQWALRIMDAIDKYDPDFIYTDGTDQKPFSGSGTGTGVKADAMQRVIAYYYNQSLQKHGYLDKFSVVKFRNKTNGTVTTEEFGVPEKTKDHEPWIAEVPVGDWYYAPDFTYDSGMMIHYIIEAIARDGNAAVCISPLPDGSLDQGSTNMLKEVGKWMKINGEAVYGSYAWKIPGEGEITNGKLKMLPGGKLGKQHAAFNFTPQDIRFTQGIDGSLFAFTMAIPQANEKVIIKALGTTSEKVVGKKITNVSLLGYKKSIDWQQTEEGLEITYPKTHNLKTAAVFKID